MAVPLESLAVAKLLKQLLHLRTNARQFFPRTLVRTSRHILKHFNGQGRTKQRLEDKHG